MLALAAVKGLPCWEGLCPGLGSPGTATCTFTLRLSEAGWHSCKPWKFPQPCPELVPHMSWTLRKAATLLAGQLPGQANSAEGLPHHVQHLHPQIPLWAGLLSASTGDQEPGVLGQEALDQGALQECHPRRVPRSTGHSPGQGARPAAGSPLAGSQLLVKW